MGEEMKAIHCRGAPWLRWSCGDWRPAQPAHCSSCNLMIIKFHKVNEDILLGSFAVVADILGTFAVFTLMYVKLTCCVHNQHTDCDLRL